MKAQWRWHSGVGCGYSGSGINEKSIPHLKPAHHSEPPVECSNGIPSRTAKNNRKSSSALCFRVFLLSTLPYRALLAMIIGVRCWYCSCCVIPSKAMNNVWRFFPHISTIVSRKENGLTEYSGRRSWARADSDTFPWWSMVLALTSGVSVLWEHRFGSCSKGREDGWMNVVCRKWLDSQERGREDESQSPAIMQTGIVRSQVGIGFKCYFVVRSVDKKAWERQSLNNGVCGRQAF